MECVALCVPSSEIVPTAEWALKLVHPEDRHRCINWGRFLAYWKSFFLVISIGIEHSSILVEIEHYLLFFDNLSIIIFCCYFFIIAITFLQSVVYMVLSWELNMTWELNYQLVYLRLENTSHRIETEVAKLSETHLLKISPKNNFWLYQTSVYNSDIVVSRLVRLSGVDSIISLKAGGIFRETKNGVANEKIWMNCWTKKFLREKNGASCE